MNNELLPVDVPKPSEAPLEHPNGVAVIDALPFRRNGRSRLVMNQPLWLLLLGKLPLSAALEVLLFPDRLTLA